MLVNGGGAIINMASILGQVCFDGLAPYVAAKHAGAGLTKQIASSDSWPFVNGAYLPIDGGYLAR
jgi:NAD(P)-dependent dehydrogenase (short-subunit alcohol dehydrogenase family)